MAERDDSIAQVRLARSIPRLLAVPLLLIVAAVGIAVAGVVLVGGTLGLGLIGAGVLFGLLGILAAAIPLSVRVHVEESVVRVRWLFGRQVHLLTAGSLTRIHLRGEGASKLSGGFGLAGWRIGRGVLRGEEDVHIVRLAPTESVILVPTARGRLAIASSDEQHLIQTLTHAAQARARTEELLEVAPAPAAATPEEIPQPGDPDFDPRLLTGIERALYEEWLVRRQADAFAAAADAATGSERSEPAAPAVGPPLPEPQPAARAVFRRPSWARRRAMDPAAVAVRTVPDRVRALPMGRPKPSWLLPLVPLAAAAAAWGVGMFVGDLPDSGSPVARLTALALVLAGPGTTIGAIMTRTWWPRISGVVVVAGLAASIFIGRSLLVL
jgi:hypothetical protein